MSSFEQDDGTFYQSTNNNSSNNNSTNSEDGSTTTKIPRPKVQFGLLELGIFVLIWVALLVSFKAYNKKSRKKKEWFGINEEKEAYESALESGEQDEEVLKKLLMRRCMTDIRRVTTLQEDKDSVMSLSRTGAISEEMLASFKSAEKDLEMEIFEVQAEAETFKPGWGESILRDAVKLSRVEDQVAALAASAAKSKGKEVKSATEGVEKKTLDRLEEAVQAVGGDHGLNEEERQQLLMELLKDEFLNGLTSPSPPSAANGGKARKRSNSGKK